MKLNSLIILFFYLFVFGYSTTIPDEENEKIIMNFYISEQDQNITVNISEKKDENAVANAIYNKSYERIGWDYLAISSYEKNDSKYNNSIKAYAMGYLEGVLTKDRIYSHYTNFDSYYLTDFKENPVIVQYFFAFFEENFNYMKEKSFNNMNSDPYWENVYYICQQFIGLYDGYISCAEDKEKLEMSQMLVLSAAPDAQEIAQAFIYSHYNKIMTEKFKAFSFYKFHHCSALVKLANDFSDIWFGHNTWNNYFFMTRILKEYRFVSNNGIEKSKTQVFSSYPGRLASTDDYFYLDSKILIMSTSLNFNDPELYSLITSNSLLNWVRINVANKMASSGEEWAKFFVRENSGTGNSQNIILDINKIDLKNKNMKDKALIILEQIPGNTKMTDVTEYLKKGYWPSYNMPFSNEIYNISGYKVEKNEEGISENIEYTQNSRAKIFKRDQENIKSLDDFKKMIRYNNYKEDNLSNFNPKETIASRYDLMDGQFKTCYGTIDSKIMSVKEILNNQLIQHIISGPTNDQQDTFSWENTTCRGNEEYKIKTDGVNIVWNYPWVDYEIQLIEKKNNSNDEPKNEEKDDNGDDNKKWIIIGIIGGIIVLLGIGFILYICLRKKNSSTFDNLNKEIGEMTNKEDEQLIQ